ncbi:hypothetical protein ABT093_19580 [Kitasatospora sp. NPDC002551]|uniref:hypothetical protein n=1 Tax=unclassified Kitasatospora TaxID=2633591 RepID=UPI003322F11C
MADDSNVLAKTEYMKRSFAEFGELKDVLADIHENVKIINKLNKSVGGNDEIGKQYHEQVDDPTHNLEELLKKVTQVVGSVGENGERLSDSFDRANEDAGARAAGL